jgi:hypothetical protein
MLIIWKKVQDYQKKSNDTILPVSLALTTFTVIGVNAHFGRSYSAVVMGLLVSL